MASPKRCTTAVDNKGPGAILGACVLAGALLASSGTQDAVAVGETRSLSMVHSHTGETLSITYKVNGAFDPGALEKLNWFLRDWRIDEPTAMAPNLFDVIWHVYREVGATEPIRIMSAYRSPGTNAMLRRRSRAVAKESQHMRGNAMDIHIPGVLIARVREIGLRLQRGGVGFYPSAGSPFVHLDVGSVRHWPKMSREQLERIFPDGKTVHIPADGKPLANYEAALAEVQAGGGTALDYATVTSGKSFWALLFGGGEEGEEEGASFPARWRAGGRRVAEAGGAGSGGAVSAFAANSDNPMNPGLLPVPAAPPAPRPLAVASPLPPHGEPPRLTDPRSEAANDTEARQPGLPQPSGLSRFEPADNVPLPPIRPRDAAFAAMVASVVPTDVALPLPPSRPAGLGSAGQDLASDAHPATTAALGAIAVPLPPARPGGLRGVERELPGLFRREGRAEPPPAAQAYAAVQVPLPPQRAPTLAGPAAQPPPPPAAAAAEAEARGDAPAPGARGAYARVAGHRALVLPAAIAAARPEAIKREPAIIEGFAAQKYLRSTGFSGSFVREIDARGGFRRPGQ